MYVKREDVLFTNSTGTTFLVDKEGVLMKPTAKFNIDDLPPANSRIWSLVDSPIKKVPPARSFTSKYPSKVFFIATLSPDRVWYHEPVKRDVRIWWMSAWMDEEIFTLYVPCGLTDRFVTDLRPLSNLNSLSHSPKLSITKFSKNNSKPLPPSSRLRNQLVPVPVIYCLRLQIL